MSSALASPGVTRASDGKMCLKGQLDDGLENILAYKGNMA